jgi:hypothetical protein
MGGGNDKTFDLAERELTRKKLIRYAKENGIGAGRLAKRIKASHPLEHFPIKLRYTRRRRNNFGNRLA